MPDLKEIVEDENKIDTVMADDIEFRGKLTFKNSFKVKGFFEGKIETDGHLIIGRQAVVNSDIKAGLVSVNGTVNGRIKATQSIELYSNSKTRCDLITPNIFIEKGSSFNGTCIMNEDNNTKAQVG
ncbi:MAG: polymer-forming cytoskeletal protein [Spirochaetota bacterium]|nr:polymer-forming cytoskeletal protein [Spirochaetota bacterium]